MQVPLPIASEIRPVVQPRMAVERFRDRIGADALWLWLAVLVFIAVSFWWLTQDNRIPIWDSGSHMVFSHEDGSALANGQFWVPFTVYTTYPPLVHVVGAVSDVLLGLHPMAMTMALTCCSCRSSPLAASGLARSLPDLEPACSPGSSGLARRCSSR